MLGYPSLVQGAGLRILWLSALVGSNPSPSTTKPQGDTQVVSDNCAQLLSATRAPFSFRVILIPPCLSYRQT